MGREDPAASTSALLEEDAVIRPLAPHLLILIFGVLLGALAAPTLLAAAQFGYYACTVDARSGQGVAAVAEPGAPSSPSTWLVVLLCAVSAVEGADIALLPSSMFALQRDLGFGPGQLATMSLFQAVLQAAAAPVWGVIADRRILQRRSILALGCTGWGVITALLASVGGFAPMVFLRALNGAMLACLRPISNGLVPDIVGETGRGRVYGLIQLSMNAGIMVCAVVVTPVSGHTLAGGLVQGWRLAFVMVGLLSVALATLVTLTMSEPPFGKADERDGAEVADDTNHASAVGRSSWQELLGEEAARLWSYLQTPTFTLIVTQGLFGMIPWNALGYLTLFLQTAGLGSSQAAFVCAFGTATQALGALLGGFIGDFAEKHSPDHGRPLVAQVSVLAGIPLIWLLFLGTKPGPDHFAWYCAVYGVLGLVATWCGAGVNWPIFTEIASWADEEFRVTPRVVGTEEAIDKFGRVLTNIRGPKVPPEGRSAVVAWDTAFEGISGAVFGNLAVSFLAEQCFGYRLADGNAGSVSAENAAALGRALAWTTTGPFVLCFTVYSAMHWTYPRDRHRSMLEPPASRRRRPPPP